MKIDKITNEYKSLDEIQQANKGRIPLAVGNAGNRGFVLSIFVDGSGCILEFNDGDKYVLRTEEIVAEILKEKDK